MAGLQILIVLIQLSADLKPAGVIGILSIVELFRLLQDLTINLCLGTRKLSLQVV